MPTKIEIPQEVVLAAAASKAIQERKVQEQDDADSSFKKKQATVAALAADNPAGSSTTTESDNIQREVLMALLESLRDESRERSEKKRKETEERNRLMLAQASNIKEQKIRQEANQNACDHRKENGKSRLGGQRLSNNHTVLICTFCHKEWDETTVPPHLMIPGEFIGG